MESFIEEVVLIVSENHDLYTGVVRDFLLEGTGVLPREFLRISVDYCTVPLTYTLFGLSGWCAYKLAIRLARNLGLTVPEVPHSSLIDDVQVNENDVYFVQNVDFDAYPYGLLREEKINYKYLVIAFWLFCFCFVDMIFTLPFLVVVFVAIFRNKKYTIVESHYADLISWSRGRQRNAALYHAMRGRLYRNFFSQYEFSLVNAKLFADTLDAAFEAKTYVR